MRDNMADSTYPATSNSSPWSKWVPLEPLQPRNLCRVGTRARIESLSRCPANPFCIGWVLPARPAKLVVEKSSLALWCSQRDSFAPTGGFEASSSFYLSVGGQLEGEKSPSECRSSLANIGLSRKGKVRSPVFHRWFDVSGFNSGRSGSARLATAARLPCGFESK